MIEHLVMIRFKAQTTEDEKNSVLQELLTLKEKIPGIVDYKVGHNVSQRSQGFDAAIASTFADIASLEVYGPHPEHQRVASRLKELSDDIVVIDFQPLTSPTNL